jgi:RNA 2',3'-cyclic 3'-phosphodiesterase
MIRAFIAIKIDPDDEFIRAYQVLKNQLANEKINWVDINNLHLTLKFLGDVSYESLIKIKDSLKKIKSVSAFSFRIEGIHLFKDVHNPRIIYSKINAGHELNDLTDEVDNHLHNLNFSPNEKKINPHLTLGRIKMLKEKDKLETILHDLRKIYFQQIECQEFILYESILKPTGPVYKVIDTFQLY